MARAGEEAPSRKDAGPGQESRRRGRPALLDLPRIIDAAMQMDPDRLTMQGVAKALGVAPTSLYRWVSDREQLLDLVSEEMSRRIRPAGEPTPDGWRQWLIDFARAIRVEFGAVQGYAGRQLTGPHRRGTHEHLEQLGVQAFAYSGVSLEVARQRWYAFLAAVFGWVAIEQNERFPTSAPLDFEVLLETVVPGYSGSGRAG
jgi:AcrR family transcriptional regulator